MPGADADIVTLVMPGGTGVETRVDVVWRACGCLCRPVELSGIESGKGQVRTGCGQTSLQRAERMHGACTPTRSRL